MNTYIDFHSHSVNSDGALTPMEVCRTALEAGIRVLAITDHNYTGDLTDLQAAFPQIRLVQGAEISCIGTDDSGKETELHVVALGVDPDNPRLQAVLKQNQPDRQPYIDAILEKLRLCGIDLGSYRDLCRLLNGKRHIGRMDICKLLVERGYVSSIEEGFDEYVGGHGKQRAYVPNRLRYVSLEQAVEAILDAAYDLMRDPEWVGAHKYADPENLQNQGYIQFYLLKQYDNDCRNNTKSQHSAAFFVFRYLTRKLFIDRREFLDASIASRKLVLEV